jgi:hypothetical protein
MIDEDRHYRIAPLYILLATILVCQSAVIHPSFLPENNDKFVAPFPNRKLAWT